MSDVELDELSLSDNEYTIVEKRMSDILDDMEFEDLDERLFCESIISNIEKTAADMLRDNKVVNIPYIGCLRKDPLRRLFRENGAELKKLREQVNIGKYQDEVRSLVTRARISLARKDREKHYLKRIRQSNKKTYDELYIKLGYAYAEMFIFSLSLMRVVEYDEEFEEYYKQLIDE